MSETIDRVYAWIEKHPFTTITRIREEVRKPVQEVEACVDSLRRTGKIAQVMPGLWCSTIAAVQARAQAYVSPTIHGKRRRGPPPKVSQEGVAPGFRKCSDCERDKPLLQFVKNGRCRPCNRRRSKLWNSNRRTNRDGTPKVVEMVA